MFHRTIAASLLSVACALPLAALAQGNGTENYYVPPKLVKRGLPQSPIAGPGIVVVKVLVSPNGSFKVEDVIRSTNHGNDAAAREIAQSSTYRPATRGGKTVVAFYDFTLKFSASSVSSGGDEGTLAGYERMIRAGNFSGAKAGLAQYVAAHPDDKAAQVDLGVAATFLLDYPRAAAAFDAAGPIPANYRTVAGKAYAEHAAGLVTAKDFPGAIAAGRRAVELSPGIATYNALGFAELNSGDAASAIKDLGKARDLAAEAKAAARDRAAIGSNLTSAYLAAGEIDAAKTSAAEVAKLDPSATGAQVAFLNYYVKKARAFADAGQQLDAASAYEQAAQSSPATAGTMYANAAFSYLSVKPNPESLKAKADADKALAIDANNAAANFAAGIALANDGKTTDALTFLHRAETLAKAGNDPGLTANIQSALKQLSGK